MEGPAESSPWGPWTDYSRTLGAAEDAAAIVVDALLSDGGTVLWQKYLERKAFPFAAESVMDAVVSRLKMCFVAHDQGEDTLGDGWDLEDEPEPGQIDSWARMHLRRRLTGGQDGPIGAGGTSSSMKKPGGAAAARGGQGRILRGSEPRQVRGRGGRAGEKAETRSAPIAEELVVDEEEERLRDVKSQEEVKKRDQEKKVRDVEKFKDEERKKVQTLHEEMAKRAHTFDSEGNIIWMDDLKIDRLPKTHEAFGYFIKKDPRQKMEDTIRSVTGSGKDAPTSPTKGGLGASGGRHGGRRGNRGGRFDRRQGGEGEFTDSFSKLQHGQPPVLETMQVVSGVVLEALGKRKGGVEQRDSNQMSRKEYVQLAEREMSRDYRGSPTAAAGADGKDSSQSLGGTASAALLAAAAQEAGVAGQLPPIGHGRHGGGRYPRAPGDPDGAPAQRAPQAPPHSNIVKKFHAVGERALNQLPPRYRDHKTLGGVTGAIAHPPLGATMGHGLMRHGSLKEDYFFPPTVPDLPMGLLRSQSEAALGSGRRSGRGSGRGSNRTSPKGGMPKTPNQSTPKGGGKDTGRGAESPGGGASGSEGEEDGHGKVKADAMSPAYRNFRYQLCPELATSGYGRF